MSEWMKGYLCGIVVMVITRILIDFILLVMI